MIFIGENIHIISKSVQNALIVRDENFIKNILQQEKNMDFADLNVGPAKGELNGIFSWLWRVRP